MFKGLWLWDLMTKLFKTKLCLGLETPQDKLINVIHSERFFLTTSGFLELLDLTDFQEPMQLVI